jgi:hypothetical protein
VPEGVSLAVLTPAGLIGLFFLLVFTGALVPWRFYKEKREEADKWRKVAETEREARATSDAQTKALLELAKTDHEILVSLLRAADNPRRSGETHVVSTTST